MLDGKSLLFGIFVQCVELTPPSGEFRGNLTQDQLHGNPGAANDRLPEHYRRADLNAWMLHDQRKRYRPNPLKPVSTSSFSIHPLSFVFRRRLTGLASDAERLPFDAPIEEHPDRISDLQSRQGILVWIVHNLSGHIVGDISLPATSSSPNPAQRFDRNAPPYRTDSYSVLQFAELTSFFGCRVAKFGHRGTRQQKSDPRENAVHAQVLVNGGNTG
jgi:hypothetical protein